jgi:hypothetical protein
LSTPKGREKGFPAAAQGCKKFPRAARRLWLTRHDSCLPLGFTDKPLVRMENK